MKKKAFPIIIFADGASSGNPGPGGWGAVIATPSGHIVELGGSAEQTTNNRMELIGVIRALNFLGRVTKDTPDTSIEIYTDSTYVIRGITQWVWGWRKRHWKTSEGEDVANQDLWKQLSGVVANKKISWKYVRGHSGVPGNERVDEIAVLFSKGTHPRLYEGPLLGYNIAIHDLPEDTDLPELKSRAQPKAAPYSYLSLVGGVPMRHKTWSECERRVKGQSGAKFKKAMNSEQEAEILAAWGFESNEV